MACIHVILKEFFADRDTPYFTGYVKQFTNLPFLVILDKDGTRYQMGRFLRASDVTEYAGEENADWKLVMMDGAGKLHVPCGSLGFRWEKEPSGNWNLQLKNAVTKEEIDPLLTLLGKEEQRVAVSFSDFTGTFDIFMEKTKGKGGVAKEILREVPARRIKTKDGKELVVTTAFDLLMAQAGVSRGLGGDYPKNYDDPRPYTPAWQETQTGVSRNLAIQVGREFAENAEKTRGKSLVITGPGIQHWYHGASLYYRNEAVMLALCGCNGVNGGNFNHYVGTQHTRLHAPFVNLGAALDWYRPPRMMNTTSLWYFHTGQYRYDGMQLDAQLAVGAKQMARYKHAADVNALAVRMGWLPFFPQVDKKNPLRLYEEAVKAGCTTDDEVKAWVLSQFKAGKLEFAIHDPEAKENHLKVLTVYRGNLIGTSMRGHELALKHFLGTHHNVLWENEPAKGLTDEIEWREPYLGKLDLLVSLNIRMDSTANYADIVLPAAFWYEKYDVTFGDMHTFVHPLTPATDPPWEAKSDWDAFVAIAAKFSELAKKHLPKPVKDIVFKALWMDSPDMMAQPMGEVKDWRKGECEPIPGKTFPQIAIVERDYTKVYDQMISLGPLVCKPKGYGSKGQYTDLTPIVEEELKHNEELTVKNGRVYFEKPKQACEVICQISPELNGRLAHMFFTEMEKKVGLPLADMVEPVKERRVHYKDIISQPRRIHTTPQWAAVLFDPKTGKQRTFAPWTMNVERLKPWHTLSGRQEIYYDHQGIREYGEALPTNKPPLDMVAVGDVRLDRAEQGSKLFRFITPHGKWQIHSSFRDHWPMLHMSRGGPTVWLNPDDAKEIGVEDNDWVELYCENGIEVVRAVTSHQVPKKMAVTYHQVERHINVPFSPLAKKRGCTDLRGGNNNATTRILMNPATMVGGYAQFTFYSNFWGPSPSERDHCVLIRKMPAPNVGNKPAIYREEELGLVPSR
jgi:nitrate reductase alpha subunit